MSCAVKGCSNCRRLRGKDISFHLFPTNDLQEEWLKVLRIDKEQWVWTKNKVVCSEHFKKTDFIGASSRRLRPNSIPSIKLVSGGLYGSILSKSLQTKAAASQSVFQESTMSSLSEETEMQVQHRRKGPLDSREKLEMGQSEEIFCRLCLNATNNENSTVIEGIHREILEFLLSKLKHNGEENQVLCNTCSTKLFAAYNFKAVCMETEDSIFPYINSKLLDMKEIFFIKNGYEQGKNMSEDLNVCRLCMQLLSCEFIPLKEVDIEMVHEYITEVDFKSTKDPVICEMCFKSLIAHSSFLRTCSDTEEKLKYTDDCNVGIKTEEVHIKIEENSFPSTIQLDVDQFDTTLQHPTKVQTYSCDKCAFQSKYKCSVVVHQIQHKDPSELEIYKCDRCKYEAKKKCNLMSHRLKHKDVSEVQMYKCDECDFQTKRKRSFNEHQSRHKDSSDALMYRCDKCNFGTKRRQNLGHHQLMHKKPLETHKCNECEFGTEHKHILRLHELRHKHPTVRIYKCGECQYETIHRNNLEFHQSEHKGTHIYQCSSCEYKTKYRQSFKQHEVVHKDPSEIRMYKCKECQFQTKHRKSLAMHKLKHKNPTELRMYKCDQCSYETKTKGTLTSHQLIHKKPSELQLFKCDKCEYTAIRKKSLKLHELIHKDPSEVEMHKCTQCKYETKNKHHLASHVLKHKDPSEVEMFKCSECMFQTKRKHSLKDHRKAKHKDSTYVCDKGT